jgi:hypothetical protein
VSSSRSWAYTCNGGWSTKRAESSVATTRFRSATLSLFAGTTRVARSGVAGFLPAVARDRPVKAAAALVVTPAARRFR